MSFISLEISGSLWGPFLLHWVLCQRKKLVLFMKTETFNAISKSYKRCFLEVFIMIPLLGLGLLWTLMCTSCTFCPLVWCATICQVDLIWFSNWWSHFLSHAIKSSFKQKISNAMRSYAIYIYIYKRTLYKENSWPKFIFIDWEITKYIKRSISLQSRNSQA